MKLLKRNAIVLTVIVFVCAAVYLNWRYNTSAPTDIASPEPQISASPSAVTGAEEQLGDLFYTGLPSDPVSAQLSNDGGETVISPVTSAVADYFADARLARQQARDSAVTILRETAQTSSASQNVKDDSLAAMSSIANNSLLEAELESMIRAKGFAECVVFLNSDSVTVTVPTTAAGLTETEIGRIADVAITETGLSYDSLKIIEVK
ncbi:MAG: SpoIIIAH-like family protein [Oscillospiraceae bacterium]|jgi:stage III sporulation protein AH|nr:SpoIIIAH-like family protein [Oscillospiraceae bacterium]